MYFRIPRTIDGDLGARYRLREALCIRLSQRAPNQGFSFIKSWYEHLQTARGRCAGCISVSYYYIVSFELSNKEQHMVKSFEIQEHMQEYEI